MGARECECDDDDAAGDEEVMMIVQTRRLLPSAPLSECVS